MNPRLRKTKQYLIALAKLLVVGAAFYFIYDRITNNEQLDWHSLYNNLQGPESFVLLAAILLLTFANRFFEVLKWQNLVSYLRPITIAQSAEQVLAAVTAAIFTPNGLGEYAAKALYFKKSETKDIIFLNLICNGVQLIIAVLAGIGGVIIFNSLYNALPGKILAVVVLGICGLILVVFFSRKVTFKGYSLRLLGQKVNDLPKVIHRKNNVLAILRYLAILHQHYLILLLFNIHLPYYIIISTIAAVYFIGSSLPTFQFLDFAVRGSIAVYFFGKLEVNEWIVVFAATLQWLLNIVIPVVIGSYYVFRFKVIQERGS